MDGMTFLVLAASAGVLVSLYRGIASMAQGGEADQLHSYDLMLQRVGWQGLAVLLLLLALLAS